MTVVVAAVVSDATNTASGLVSGQIVVTLSGGATPYTLLWSTGATTGTLTGLTAGSYWLRVTESNSTVSTFNFTVKESLGVTFTVTGATSYNAGNGEVYVNVYGGVLPYTFTWSHGPTGQQLRRVKGGEYHVTVADSNGLTGTSTAIVGRPIKTKTMGADEIVAKVALDVGADGALYFGDRAMRLSFSSATGTLIVEKYISGTWTKKLEI